MFNTVNIIIKFIFHIFPFIPINLKQNFIKKMSPREVRPNRVTVTLGKPFHKSFTKQRVIVKFYGTYSLESC